MFWPQPSIHRLEKWQKAPCSFSLLPRCSLLSHCWLKTSHVRLHSQRLSSSSSAHASRGRYGRLWSVFCGSRFMEHDTSRISLGQSLHLWIFRPWQDSLETFFRIWMDVSRRPQVTDSPFGERVKKCMNHLRDSLVAKFSHASLSASLVKSSFSVCKTPSIFSNYKSLDLARLFAKGLHRDFAFETGSCDQIIGGLASCQPVASPTNIINFLILEKNVHIWTHYSYCFWQTFTSMPWCIWQAFLAWLKELDRFRCETFTRLAR